jgi:hypothetical protein
LKPKVNISGTKTTKKTPTKKPNQEFERAPQNQEFEKVPKGGLNENNNNVNPAAFEAKSSAKSNSKSSANSNAQQ